MLGKLLKHDFRAAKMVLPFYGVSLVLWGMVYLLLSFGAFKTGIQANATSNIIGAFLTFFAVLSLFAVLGVSAAYAVLHFGKQTIGAQGQIMFTLPVSANQFLISKLISGASVLVCAIAYIIFSFISFGGVLAGSMSTDGQGTVQHFAFDTSLSGAEFVLFAAEIGLLMITAIIAGLLMYYLSVGISGYISQNRVAGTVAAFLIIGFSVQMATLLVIIISGFILFETGAFQNVSNESFVFYSYAFVGGAIAVIAMFDTAMYFICRHYYTKKLNLP